MKIYTKKGDAGQTSLFGQNNVSKSSPRVDSYGDLDELNSQIGLLVSELGEHSSPLLTKIQHRIFSFGSHLACGKDSLKAQLPQLRDSWIKELEDEIDRMTSKLPPQTQFILPGGTKAASLAHVCRTVCRRTERKCVSLSREESVDSITLIFLNRLSDYFQVLARFINLENGVSDIFWEKE
ncbi:MAG: cob(I)yrinic acid a,c-diamide adenosyltransferase [Bdellovibrionales bacterium]|nr:cob(I)yrinic acid a,c-diamide adenosyltransferase [Bdellovibrionales bacterium]